MRLDLITEACQHLSTGLEVLATVPETPARHQHELDLLMALNLALQVTKGYGVHELESGLTRAEVLSQQVGEPLMRELGIKMSNGSRDLLTSRTLEAVEVHYNRIQQIRYASAAEDL